MAEQQRLFDLPPCNTPHIGADDCTGSFEEFEGSLTTGHIIGFLKLMFRNKLGPWSGQ